MRRLKRATIALPMVVLLLGVVVPVLLERDDPPRASGVEVPEARVSGRTSGEWAQLAFEALERGRLRKALSHIKTAESVSPGTQYATELKEIRLARRRASDIERSRGRLVEGPVDHVAFGEDGAVVQAHRQATVLPGESLWTLARDLVAARRLVPGSEVVSGDRDVYRAWDELTTLNGVRELEVGERVRVPLAIVERTALADANRRDHERIVAAFSALAAGDIDEAARLRGEFEEGFARATAECLRLDDTLATATAERTARLELDRECALVEDVRDALARVPEMPRATRHSDRVDVLNGARAALSEAEALRGGVQYPDAAKLVARLLSEETRFAIEANGTVKAEKSTGVSYTQAARQAVEWVLERELRSSGRSFPHSNEKSADERAWARYLADAARAASEGGVSFTELLEAVDEVVELRLPDPVIYFAN